MPVLFDKGVDCSCRMKRRAVHMAALVVLRRDVKSVVRLGGGSAMVETGLGGWGC